MVELSRGTAMAMAAGGGAVVGLLLVLLDLPARRFPGQLPAPALAP